MTDRDRPDPRPEQSQEAMADRLTAAVRLAQQGARGLAHPVQVVVAETAPHPNHE